MISWCQYRDTQKSSSAAHLIMVLSFAELDVRKAVKIQEDEAFIDKIYKERLPQLIESNNTKCALAEALLLSYLERLVIMQFS